MTQGISASKMDLLQKLRAEKGLETRGRKPPRPRRNSGACPLSYSQERLWFLDKFGGQNGAFNVPAMLCLRGELDRERLAAAVNETVQRHEVLRTAFVEDGEDVRQIVQKKLKTHIPFQDLSGLSESEKNIFVARTALECAMHEFSLARLPLIEFTLLKLAEDEHILALTMHHIISDGWSVGVFTKEISEIYAAFEENRAPQLSLLPIQYADYAVWQRENIRNGSLEKQTRYWSEQLSGKLPVLDLPLDKPRPKIRLHRGANYKIEFDETLTAAVINLARRNRSTLFVALLAGYKILLHRYSRQNEIIVGTSVANRNLMETEPLIGFFLNSLVLRSFVSKSESFAAFLKKLTATSLEAFENQDAPVELLIERLKPVRDAGVTPFFQTLFVMQNNPSFALRIGSLAAEIIEVENNSAKFDISVSAEEKNGKIRLDFEYDTDLFEAATIQRFAHNYRNLMGAVASDEELLIKEINFLEESETAGVRQMSEGARTTENLHPVHELIAAQAARTPGAIAVHGGENALTYRELDAQANRLARMLTASGINIEDRIGLYFERSPEMVIALLAILKTGAIYVPIDPRYPLDRQRFIVEDAKLSAVLSHRAVKNNLGANCPFFVWEDLIETLKDYSGEAPTIGVDGENPAYLIYTSGSTGKQKAVVLRHTGLSSYARHAAREFDLSPKDRVLQFASLSFDASAEEIFPCLMSGGTLVLRNDEMLATMTEFTRRCAEWKITVLDLPTAFWHLLVEAFENESVRLPESVRLVIIGGEKAKISAVRKWTEKTPKKVTLYNTYGPTETTIVATSEKFGDPERKNSRELGIGKPVSNTRSYVVDEQMRLVPRGVIGELCVGGAGLARGYLNQAALTAEKFVPDPFGAGERLYRTGDLARWNNAGKLEFVGRADRQVKVRGYRVEPGEIETVLMRSGQVKQAAVLASSENLTAYLVKAGERIEVEELRDEMKSKLPDYLRPQRYVEVDKIPLTMNGKIDEKALRENESTELRTAAARERESPITEVEEQIARIWSELLGTDGVGRRENFFELGGHSLLVTKCLARLRDRFGIDIPLRDFFENPTIAATAAAIENGETSHAMSTPKIEKAPENAVIPLSFPQERIWFLCQLDPTNAAYNVPRATRITGRLDKNMVEKTFTEIFRRHEILRTTFHTIDGQPVQKVNPPQVVEIKSLDWRHLPAERQKFEIDDFIEREGNVIFDVSTLPLLRLNLLQTSDDEHILVMVEHHLLHDGWTQGVLMNDFMRIYEAFVDGRESPLAPLKIQYGDFAYWQKNWLTGENLARLLKFWRKTLRGAPELLQLPTAFPRPAVRSSRGSETTLELDEKLTENLRELSRRNDATLFMTMLAAFKALFYRYSGQTDIVVGSGVANRNLREIEDLIGMVVNTIPFRTELSGGSSFIELLEKVRSVTLDGYAHQDVPFEKMVETMNPERNLAYTPIFQVLISFLNTPMRTMRLAGLDFEGVDAHNKSAKFDLNIIIVSPEDQNRGLQARAENSRLTILLEYSTDLYDEQTVKRLLSHYENFLRSIIAAPQKKLRDLDYLSETEKSVLMTAHKGVAKDLSDRKLDSIDLINDAERRFLGEELERTKKSPAVETIAELIENQAEQNPDAIALKFGEETFSYRELNETADLVARKLARVGIKRGSVVGICAGRSAETIISLLAILKAGAAYLPLDTDFPAERLSFMALDSRAELILGEHDFRSKFAETAVDFYDFNSLFADSAESLESAVLPPVIGEDAAYIIYTSGSTGPPKGVMATHRAVAGLTQADYIETLASDVFLQYAPLSFDASTFEIWTCLARGAKLVVAPPEKLAPAELGEIIANERVTILWLTAGLFHLMIRERCQDLKGLRYLLAGGDVLAPEIVRQAMKRLPSCRIVNGYGPTETTTFAACSLVENTDLNGKSIPIGRPVSNTRSYVLDEQMRLVPRGVIGELCVGGAGLARGYLNQAALTAEKFVPDPFRAGERLYRTGDLARWNNAGKLEFVGRADRQVKVRGYRVELGEVESVLTQSGQVKQAAVLANGETLTAYLIKNFARLDLNELRNEVSNKLPEHLRPQKYVEVSEISLTVNGKIDAKKLQKLGEIEPRTLNFAEFEPPQGETEKLIARIWAELLKIEEIGRRENFFELGGHSLLAARILSRIKDSTGIDVPLREVFAAPTIESLATIVEEKRGRKSDDAVQPIKRAARKPFIAGGENQ